MKGLTVFITASFTRRATPCSILPLGWVWKIRSLKKSCCRFYIKVKNRKLYKCLCDSQHDRELYQQASNSKRGFSKMCTSGFRKINWRTEETRMSNQIDGPGVKITFLVNNLHLYAYIYKGTLWTVHLFPVTFHNIQFLLSISFYLLPSNSPS